MKNSEKESERIKFAKGDFIRNLNPYEGEGDKMVVDFEYCDGKFYGYKCAMLKGKHCKENDFDNHFMMYWQEAKYYKKVD